MKLKINKACDLSSISVLPPQSRRQNAGSNGTQTSQRQSQPSQHRSQPSQQSFSQSMFSQFSQNSMDEALTNDQRFGSQERENSVKRPCFPPNNHSGEESQMLVPRSSTNLMRKWSSLPDHKCLISEDLDRRIGMIETSLNKLGMILDSLQSDVMQVNKATKEVLLELEGIRQKFAAQDNLLQLMNKEQYGMKDSLDRGFKYISEQASQDLCEHKLKEISLVLSTLPEKIEAAVLKSQSELSNSFIKEIKTMPSHLATINLKDQTSINLSKVQDTIYGASQQGKSRPNQNSAVPPKVFVQATIAPKIETRGWKAAKKEKVNFTNTKSEKMHEQKGCPSIKQERECRIIVESDNDSDGGFSFLLEERTLGTTNYFYEDVQDETERILRIARRRKRKCRNTVTIS